jgi:hypothetical protein
MLKDRIDMALKEWAVVQRSLLEQHQFMLVRKGGIAEETGDFDLRANQFLLMPTYEHEVERKGDLQPCFEQWLNEENARKPEANQIRLECACEVADVIRVDDRDVLLNMLPQHIWSRQFIDGRFDWEPYKPVTVLLLRAYRLAAPVVLPFRREYAGCRSWITLDGPVSTEGSTPAIVGDANFAKRLSTTSALLRK